MSVTFADLKTMALTVYGEARGESFDGQVAVAHVILNRTKVPGKTWWGDTITEVCRKPYQFSCWNPGDPNAEKLRALEASGDLSDRALQWCLMACIKAIAEKATDPTGGADHYHVRGLSPKWARGRDPVAEIGHHVFYRLGA